MTSPSSMPRPHPLLPALYFVVGQIAWFACVIGGAKGYVWAGEALAVVLVVIHIVFSGSWREELKLVASVAAIGLMWEAVTFSLGLVSYPGSASLHGLPPLWLPALWATFAAQLNTTYGWLKPRLWMAAILGAFAGPLSFRAGAALGAVYFPRFWPAMITLAIGWAVLLPVAILLSRRWPGNARP